MMKRATTELNWSMDRTHDLLIVVACAVGLLVIGAITIHRRD